MTTSFILLKMCLLWTTSGSMSISCQVCSLDIACILLERQNITGSTIILNIVRQRTIVHWSAGVQRLFPSLKTKTKKCFVLLEITVNGRLRSQHRSTCLIIGKKLMNTNSSSTSLTLLSSVKHSKQFKMISLHEQDYE